MLNCFFFKVTVRASAGVDFLNGVKVFVKGAVTCDKVQCSPIAYSVVYEGSIQLLFDFLMIVAKSHLRVSLSVLVPVFVVSSLDFGVNLAFDVGLWDGAMYEVGTSSAELC